METSRSQALAEDLYEADFYSWTQAQAALLKAGRLDQIDIPNLIEEIDSLGRGQINALRSRYAVLCAHLLKYAAQPERRGRSWTLSIIEQRVQIQRLLADSPGLKSRKASLFREGYVDGRKFAATETGIETFPVEPPFTNEQVDDERWLP